MGPTSSRFRPSREQLWRARSRRGSGFAGTVESTSSRGTYSVQGDRAGAARRGAASRARFDGGLARAVGSGAAGDS
ncbi:hypothetical protein CERSUDRAFT_101499 [Gelatoporia subvermispora B]|uniref:Uncharacterized protein n=1 Tax=Ceriporiopsis subvermispora (strain B) TaxID=914234 RepID=M2P562_CERS8|nr:hypothetical protein CERSUDRAFT_101499 [Gelatoporia subvermispora B]